MWLKATLFAKEVSTEVSLLSLIVQELVLAFNVFQRLSVLAVCGLDQYIVALCLKR